MSNIPATKEAGHPSDNPRSEPGALNLAGRTILIIEDDVLIGMDIVFLLEEAGMTVIGPACNVADACSMIKQQRFETALVDANLNGHPVDAVAALLSERSIPFAFCTGYGADALPQASRNAMILSKPFDRADLERIVTRLCRIADDQRHGQTAPAS